MYSGGQALNDKSEDNGKNKLDDSNEKLDWRGQVDYMLESILAMKKEVEIATEVVRS